MHLTLYAGRNKEGFRLAIAKITGQGLMSIAILVALLWACVIGERIVVERANAETSQTLRAMRSLQIRNRREPAAISAPSASRPHPRLG